MNEPKIDWSDSQTMPLDPWKNPLLSIEDRLKCADGSIAFYREVIKHLREQLKQCQNNNQPPITIDIPL